MYRLIFISLICLLGFSTSVSAQNCNACFSASTDSLNPFMLNIDASCSNAGLNANYDWYVDGIYYGSINAQYFQLPLGWSNLNNSSSVLLVISDGNCVDSATQNVTFSYSCSATFTEYPSPGLGYAFYPNASFYSPTAQFHWDFGDGNADSSSYYAYHMYAGSGTYNVCFSVSDTANPSCADTFCKSITVTGNPSCQAIIGGQLLPLAGAFFGDASTSIFNPLNYQFIWSVNGVVEQQGSSLSFFYPFPSAGNYLVTLALADTNGQICDSTSVPMVYSGIGGGTPNCLACFNYNYLNTDSILFDATCSVIPAGGELQWNLNGVNQNNNSSSFVYVFQNAGYQYVSLYVKDSLGGVCDSFFQAVYVAPPPCSSCLSVTPVPNASGDYVFDASCNTGNNLTYMWYVNSNYVANTYNPQFNYSFSQSGQYDVCLQVFDYVTQSYCNMACTTINVVAAPSTLFDISGTIYVMDSTFFSVSPAGLNEAKVYLITLSSGGILNAIDSTLTDAFGNYTFFNKPVDDYRIKAALETASPNYSINIPTYYPYNLMWYDAQVITLVNNLYSKDIYMQYGNNAGGSGFISGSVFQGANKTTEANENDKVSVILIDQITAKPVAYAKPDANGYYEFANIPYGQYKVVGELLNRASIADALTLDATQSNLQGRNFVYNKNVIKPTLDSAPTSIGSVVKNLTVKAYPNPAQRSFVIQNVNATAQVKVLNLSGATVYSNNGKTAYNVDCSAWPRSLYLLEVQDKAGTQRLKLTVE